MYEWLTDFSKKEKLLWAVFLCVSFQLALQFPDVKLIPGERTNVFSGLLCGVALFTLLFVRWKEVHFQTPEWIICIVLSIICFISGLNSGDPPSSLWRGLTLIFSAVGGFWCGRLLISTPLRRVLFGRLCVVLMTFLLLMGLAGYYVYDNVLHIIGMHKHPFNDLILLLSFGPLSLLFKRNRWKLVVGICYLSVGYYVLSRSFDPLVWFPPLLFLGVLLLGQAKRKYIIFSVIAVFLLALSFHIYKMPKYFFDKESICVWVRVENIFFSYHMAKKKPLLGIGLVAPRLQYLDDYDIVYPHVTKEQFAEVLPDENRSSENQILTFMCDLGFPFLLLYCFSVLVLYKRLLGHMLRKSSEHEFNPVLIWVPVTGAILHFQFFDGLLYPQTAWFFHIFLGMIPVDGTVSVSSGDDIPETRPVVDHT